jgi:hypothetical protein
MITVETTTVRAGEAAKLMLLQRVGGAVGDDLLTQLQPLLLIDEVLRAKLAGREADTQALREQVEQIRPAVQRAVSASAAAAEWLLPRAGARTLSTELAAECVALLRPEFELGGLRIEVASEGGPLDIDRAQARTMICAVLAHAADVSDGPRRISIQLRHHDGVCEVRVARRQMAGALATDFLAPRLAPLPWNALRALADLERAALRREDDGTVVLALAAAAKA